MMYMMFWIADPTKAPPPVLVSFIMFMTFTLFIMMISNKTYRLVILYTEMFKVFLKDLLFSKCFASMLALFSLMSFIISVITDNWFLKDLSFSLSYLIILSIALFFYLDMFDNFSQQMMNQKICMSTINGKPVSKTYSIIIKLPSLIFSVAFVFILVYNLYDMGAKGAIYLSLDSHFSLRIGTHLPGWSVASPYCNLDANAEDLYDQLEGKMKRMFTTYSYRYTWAIDMSPAEKHKVMSWLSDRIYWSVEYQCNRLNVNFNTEYWEVISATMKLFPIDGQTFTTLYEWRHDEFNFTPEGHRTFPRIVLKFYHD